MIQGFKWKSGISCYKILRIANVLKRVLPFAVPWCLSVCYTSSRLGRVKCSGMGTNWHWTFNTNITKLHPSSVYLKRMSNRSQETAALRPNLSFTHVTLQICQNNHCNIRQIQILISPTEIAHAISLTLRILSGFFSALARPARRW